jgi:hypothetical protein
MIKEAEVIGKLMQLGYVIDETKTVRRSAKECDVNLSGVNAKGNSWIGWLPLTVINNVEWSTDDIWDLQDGYGIKGYKPSQGADWSGIRDSSPAQVWAMFEVALPSFMAIKTQTCKYCGKHRLRKEEIGATTWKELSVANICQDCRGIQ